MEPMKMELGQDVDGRHFDIWLYRGVPEGMRRATLRDLWHGRPVLYQVEIGPHAGLYYTGHCIGRDTEAIRRKVKEGVPVYVKD